MAGKVHEIAFSIAGKLASGFSSTFKNASKTVQTFNTQLNTLNKQAAQVDNVIRLKKEVGESAREYYQARQKVAELGQAISNTAQPTKKMIAEFNRAKEATARAKTTLDKKRQSLKEVQSAAGLTGQSLQKLIQRNKALTDSANKARIAQEKHAKAMDNIRGAAAGVKENAPYAAMSGAAAGAGLVSSVQTAMSFEDQQAELRKYSDEYKDIFEGIKGLTQSYGKTSEDMTNMAAAAMQAGIAKTGKEVLTIIEAQTQAAVAFGMTGDEVGTAWADIQSKMGLDVGKTKDVFDIINKLGNETSASSADIIEVLQRQGGTLKGLTKLSAEQIAGLAGAFRSAAPSAEVAATSMGTFIGRLGVGASATKAQQQAFEALGLDSVEMAKQLTGSSESAQAAIQDVLKRIDKLPEHEKGAVIGRLFGTEAGIKSAVSTLASQTQLLSGNLETVADKTNYSGSMLKEYQSRADTTSESLKIAQNSLKLVSAQLGIVLLPYVRKAAEAFTEIAPKVLAWIKENQGLVKTLTFAAAAIAGMTAAAVPLFIAWKTLAFYGSALKLVMSGIALMFKKTTYAMIANKAAMVGHKISMVASKVAMVATKTAMLAWKGAVALCTAAQWAWNVALNANPIGLVIIAIAALVAAGVWLYKNWDTVKAAAISLWSKITECFGWVQTKVQELWASFAEKFPAIAGVFQKYFGDVIMPIVDNVKTYFSNLIDFVKNVFTGEWGAAWENVKNMFGAAFGALAGLVKMPFNGVISIVNSAIKAINNAVSKVSIPDWVPVWGGKSFSFNIPEIPMLANGGVVTKPTLSMIGEGNEAEAVLPLSKLKSMIGGGAGGAGGSISVNFAPVINISGAGGGAYSEVKRGLEEGQKSLKRELERLLSNQKRLSYV